MRVVSIRNLRMHLWVDLWSNITLARALSIRQGFINRYGDKMNRQEILDYLRLEIGSAA